MDRSVDRTPAEKLSRLSGIHKVTRTAGYLFLILIIPLTMAAEPSSKAVANTQLDDYRTTTVKQARAAFERADYDSAVSLFKRAELAGYDDPVVFYNLGIAYYRLEKYPEAEAAFATAASFDRLAPLSYYNLGLVARKTDDNRGAHGWFRQAALHPEASSKLKRLSRKAIASLPEVRRQRPTLLAERETRLNDFLRFSFNAGYGQDSNIYRTPKDSYVDLAARGTPIIDPTPQSGSFVPLDADVEFRWSPHENSYFSMRYDFDGKIFTKAINKNGNAFRNRVAIGGRAYIPKQNGYRYFRSYFAITRYDEDYYDRTDGQDQLVGTTDISDRFKRTKFGPQIYYHRERGRFGYGLRGDAFINKYDNKYETQLDYLDLTHEQFQLGGHLSFDLLKSTSLRVSYDRYQRNYTNRKAKDENGIRFTTNEELSYGYQDAGLRLRQKLGDRLSLLFNYHYTVRQDNFEGYDDYNRHSGRAELAFQSRRFSAEAGLTYRIYEFPNGYAFDLIGTGEKTLDTLYASFEASYRLRQHYHLLFSAQMDVVNSSDPRSAYDKNQISFGMRWAL